MAYKKQVAAVKCTECGFVGKSCGNPRADRCIVCKGEVERVREKPPTGADQGNTSPAPVRELIEGERNGVAH